MNNLSARLKEKGGVDMMNRAACFVLLMFILAPAWAQSPFDGLTEGDLVDGERLFRVHCARCHGIDGAGGDGSNLVLYVAPQFIKAAAAVPYATFLKGTERESVPSLRMSVIDAVWST